MDFRLCALGDGGGEPAEAWVVGGLEDALGVAEEILERDPYCEAVEIFSQGRFIRDLERRPN